MNFYVPEIKDEIILTLPWTFALYVERRNYGLCKAYDSNEWERRLQVGLYNTNNVFAEVTLQPETVLKVERIYVRQGLSEFSSITFRIMASPGNIALQKQRFWAKLVDANKIEFEKK